MSVLVLLAMAGPSAMAQVETAAVTGQRVACSGGSAAGFSCGGADLLAFLPRDAVGGAASVTNGLNTIVNDLWGWTDPETGREYALLGRSDGTAFVDITDPVNPVYLGLLLTRTFSSSWRDIKTYANHAFVVADGAGAHGVQIFDLTQLRDVTTPRMFEASAVYTQIGSAHNIAINEETGYAYVVGAIGAGNTCAGGLHMVDIRTPRNPTFAGCFSHLGTGRANTGYTHDAQCVIYHGPDADYQGREICFGANETHISIADVSDKKNATAISSASYPNVRYAHQGWLTEDHRYFFQNDEIDTGPTRTLVWDVTDLDDPILLTEFFSHLRSRDHNLYIRGRYMYQANYTGGLRIIDIKDPAQPTEVAFFDTYRPNNGAGFQGAWTAYPFFESGNLIVSSINEGLFIVRPVGIRVANDTEEEVPAEYTLSAPYPNPFNPETRFTLTLAEAQPVTVAVFDAAGRRVALLAEGPLPAGAHTLRFEADGLPAGLYLIRAEAGGRTQTRAVSLVK